MDFLPEKINEYAESHTQNESTLLKALDRETHQKILRPRMLSGHFQGRVLSMFAKMIRPKYILEIGTYTGYSALCLAEGLVDGGCIDTIDINDELEAIQNRYFEKSPYRKNIVQHVGRALDVLPTLDKEYDLVFIDADKENYIHYYELIVPRLKSGAYIFIDNVLWSGKVVEETQKGDEETRILKALNELIQEDPRVENVLFPIRDGVMLCRVI